VSRDFARRQVRIRLRKGTQHCRQDLILLFIVGCVVFAFELNANGEVVAPAAPSKVGLACVPCALGKRYELDEFTVASDQQMRRNRKAPDLGEVRVRTPIKLIQKQRLDLTPTEYPGRQTDAMQNDHAGRCAVGPCVTIRAKTLPRRTYQPTLGINGKLARQDRFRHDLKDMSTRLFVSGALINGAELELDGDRARYLGKVLRIRVGDSISVFNGEGPEWPAIVTRVGKSAVGLELGESVDAGSESPLKIHLVQGISRGDRMDFVVQKATELGVKRITPVLTEYGVVKLNSDRAEKRRDHWQKIASSACEQSGRTRLPLIDTPVPLKNWLGAKPTAVDAELILAPHASVSLASISAPETKVCVMIGPEGGFSDNEYGDADVSGFKAVSLGPRILRTESAAIATLAILQFLWGDLGRPLQA